MPVRRFVGVDAGGFPEPPGGEYMVRKASLTSLRRFSVASIREMIRSRNVRRRVEMKGCDEKCFCEGT